MNIPTHNPQSQIPNPHFQSPDLNLLYIFFNYHQPSNLLSIQKTLD